jgi:hypothetical protein
MDSCKRQSINLICADIKIIGPEPIGRNTIPESSMAVDPGYPILLEARQIDIILDCDTQEMDTLWSIGGSGPGLKKRQFYSQGSLKCYLEREVDLGIEFVCCDRETDIKATLHCMKNDLKTRIPDKYTFPHTK